MPRRKEHISAGVPAGAAFAAIRAQSQPLPHFALETFGGAIGGWVGAQVPDELEPSTLGWNHRSFAHSWTALISALRVSGAAIREWEIFCRQKADQALQQRMAIGAQGSGGWLLVQEILWRIAAGVLAGFAAGYASHLVLDSFTKNGLPLAA